MHEERFDLIVEEESPQQGVPYSVVVSVIVHTLLIIYLIRHISPVATSNAQTPMIHYVELMRQNPQQFTEAPGPKLKTAPRPDAMMSDANRKASAPEATGDKPTLRPGDGRAVYTPPSSSVGARALARPAAGEAPAATQNPVSQTPAPSSFRQSVQVASAQSAVDWRNAIRDVAKSRAVGDGASGMDLGQAGGGEKGYADAGPLSFESEWYDWGEYAQSMVAKIRINWYGLMPEQIKFGIKGVVTIRFTIHRNGRITDITILKSSGVPPYDNAAVKALEASSPLRALPADFPNDTERVTAMFYYNLDVPK